MYDVPLDVVVFGDFACFTRPEMKVERVTYPMMTPSAARGCSTRSSETGISVANSRDPGVETDSLLFDPPQ